MRPVTVFYQALSPHPEYCDLFVGDRNDYDEIFERIVDLYDEEYHHEIYDCLDILFIFEDYFPDPLYAWDTED
jgi:hypothetical protein